MVRLGELRRYAADFLLKNNIEEARADADFLVSYLTSSSKGELVLGDKKIDGQTEIAVKKALERRASGEPVQYITGECEFFGYGFEINKATLIPRADTELLVEKAAEIIEKNNLKTFLDIGCGSGCIGISLLKNFDSLNGCLADISKQALLVAEKNAKNLNVSKRAEFLHTDILKAKPAELGRFDIIVSNPPYIETEVIKTLDKKVKDFEPLSALDGGADGLEFYRRITELAAENSLYLAFEIGYNQAEAVEKIMSKSFCDIRLFKDYGGKDRVLTGKNKQI